jgi:glycosyltransferase involved in cell wall biosynthesis
MKTRSSPVLLSIFLHDPFRIGGMEMFARELSRQLEAEQWDSAVCFDAKPSAAVREFLDLPNVRLLSLPERNKNTSSLYARDFLACLSAVHPRILHLHFTGVVNPLPWLAWFRGVGKIFYTDHTSRPAGPYQSPPIYKRWAGKALTWPLTRQIAVSKHLVTRAEVEGYVRPKKLIQIYNGTDFRRVSDDEKGASYRKRLGIASDRVIIMQVGSLIPEKGPGLLIDALALALPRNPRLHGVLVGIGPQATELKKRAGQYGVMSHMTFVPGSADPFGEGVFTAADVVCCLSNWEEAFGFTLLEAMAHGKPVIATAVGALTEIVESSGMGMVIARKDVAGLAERILQLAADPELRHRIGRSARQAVRKRFDVIEQVSVLLHLYGIKERRMRNSVDVSDPEALRSS